MIELGKRDDGITIFDNKELVKVSVLKQGMGTMVSFRPHTMDPSLQSSWQFVTVERSKNPEICETFDHFYKDAYELVQGNAEIYQRVCAFETDRGIYRRHYWKSHQITYPSDASAHAISSMMGVSKCQDQGYGLGYLQGLYQRMEDIEILLKKGEGHYPELQSLYMRLFEELEKCTTDTYENCENRYIEATYTKMLKK